MLWFIVWGLCISPDHTQARCCSQSGEPACSFTAFTNSGSWAASFLGGDAPYTQALQVPSTSLWLLSVYRCLTGEEGCEYTTEVHFSPQEMESSDIILLPFSFSKVFWGHQHSVHHHAYDDVYEICSSQEKAPFC